jgi:hypothetical protein
VLLQLVVAEVLQQLVKMDRQVLQVLVGQVLHLVLQEVLWQDQVVVEDQQLITVLVVLRPEDQVAEVLVKQEQVLGQVLLLLVQLEQQILEAVVAEVTVAHLQMLEALAEKELLF